MFRLYGSVAIQSIGAAPLWPFLLSYYILRSATDGKYKSTCLGRMGLDLPERLEPAPRIWIHALSVGEVLSVVPLVSALKELSPRLSIVFSTATEGGQDVARRKLDGLADRFITMPHDFPWLMELLVRRLKPQAFVIVETDLWPGLLRALGRQSIPRLLVNGRLSDKSYRRLQALRPLIRPMIREIDAFFVQSAQDGLRYESIGAPGDRIFDWGNLKYDAVAGALSELEKLRLRDSVGVSAERPVWIAGSTHKGEEEAIFGAHRSLLARWPDLLLILAPRQVGRSNELASMCRASGLGVVSRSSGSTASGASVLLLDTLGELAGFYALASVAFIGGSLVPFGGHNPLEAVAQGVPAVWGPHLSNFREMEASLLRAGCGRLAAGQDELEDAVSAALGDTGFALAIRQKVRSFMATNGGAGLRIARFIADRVCSRKNQSPQPEGDT